MKKILQIVFSCIMTLLLTFYVVIHTGVLLDPEWTTGAMNAIKAFHTLEEDSADVILYGSSHAWKGCDSRVMKENYGIAAYNYGCNWQALNTTLLFLEDSLRTQTPEVVFIETYKVGIVLQNTDMDGQIYYSKVISDFDGKKAYLKQCFGNDLGRYVSYYLPLVMFHDNWNKIYYENFTGNRAVDEYVQLLGYESDGGVMPAILEDPSQFTQNELPKESLEVLDKMVAVCQEKGVEIVFYTVPYEGEFAYSDAMTQYAKTHNCNYINLFEHIEDMQLSGDTDFRDPTHLNDSGAAKVANYLGKYIIDNFEINDMSMVETGGSNIK